MKHLFILLSFLCTSALCQTHEILLSDRYIDPDSADLRQLLIGTDKQLANIELHAKQNVVASFDSLGSVSMTTNAYYGVNQMYLLLKTADDSDSTKATFQLIQIGNVSQTQLMSNNIKSNASIQTIAVNTPGPSLANRAIIKLISTADKATNKQVSFIIDAGSSLQKRAVYSEQNVVLPHRGIQYAGHDYVTDPLSLTTKEYTDKNLLTHYSKSGLPAQQAGAMIYVNDATGGPVPAYSDGTNWRRVSDQTVIN